MLVIRTFEPFDLQLLELQPAQRDWLGPHGQFEAGGFDLAKAGPAWTVGDGGRLLMCAGLIREFPGQLLAWAQLTAPIGAAMVALTRAVRREHDAAEWHRLYTMVRVDFDAGHRWAAMLGFEREGVMRRWGPAAVDHAIYARIR